MFPAAASFGFHNAPVSKAFLAITGTASALHILLPALKIPGDVQLLNYMKSANISYGFLRTLCFSNVKNLFFGSLLLYSFRIFEHRYGSSKFANYLLASSLIGSTVQYTLLYILQYQDIEIGEIPTGPFAVIFSLFVPFYILIPSAGPSTFFGLFPVTRKLFTYVVGLQMLLASRGTLVSSISGLVAGVACHLNIFYVQQWLRFPDAFSAFCARLFGVFMQSSAPAEEGRIFGATLEIQRQQRMDELDQQMWRLQGMNVTHRRPAVAGNQDPRGIIGNPSGAVGGAEDRGVVRQPTVEISEEQVQRLTEMGFTRQAALQALAASNNNVAVAMNILLAE